MKPNDATNRAAEAWKVYTAGCAALLALSALAYFVGAAPLIERHNSVAQQRADLNAAREKSLLASKSLAAVQRDLARAEQQDAANPLRLQPSQTLNQRLALVNELAAETGAPLDDLQPGHETDSVYYGTLPIRVAGGGSFTTFAALLQRLHERCPDSSVSAFDVSGTPRDGDAPAKFSFQLLWYTAPLKAPDRTGEGPNKASPLGNGSAVGTGGPRATR